MENQNSFFQSVFQSATAKVIMVGVLTLVLLIPLSFVQNLIAERAERKKEVITEITSKWGESVLLSNHQSSVFGPHAYRQYR